MEDKIEVNDYMRTNKGNIGQVIGIFNGHCQAKYHIQFQGKVKVKRQYLSTHTIIKHSKQLIDLIEVEDIIKYRIDNISTTLETKGYIKGIVDIADEEMLQRIKSDKNYNILEILTKKSYMANCYKVGGEDEKI